MPELPSTSQVVDLRELKNFAAERLEPRSVLREVLLYERDQIQVGEFLAKLQVWLMLLRHRE